MEEFLTCLVNWLGIVWDYLTKLNGDNVFAAVAAFIAWQVYRLNRERMRLELFEKRWEAVSIPLAFHDANIGILTALDNKSSEEILHEEQEKSAFYLRKMWGLEGRIRALFGKEVCESYESYISTVKDLALKVKSGGNPNLIDSEYLQNEARLLKAFENAFLPYMYFGDYKRKLLRERFSFWKN